MLKFLGVIVGLVILATSAYVSPTYAASAPVVITQIQAGGVGAATQELVVIYNNTSDEIDITDWCLSNKSNVMFACFVSNDPSETLILPGYSYATVATPALADFMGFEDFTITYTPSNQSNGSIVGSTDTIKLLDASGQEVDRQSWTTSLLSGMVYVRRVTEEASNVFLDSDTSTDWSVLPQQLIPESRVEYRPSAASDVCPNIDGLQPTIPFDKEFNELGNCVPTTMNSSLVVVTELLPNASGSDADHEFIELYNPNDYDVGLNDYRLWIGPTFNKSYSFPDNFVIPAQSYRAFTNSQIHYSLLNTSSRVRIATTTGVAIDETPSYEDPKDDVAWALIGNEWRYTSDPTPGAANVAADVSKESDDDKDTRQPCASNQFRNPATGRCKLLATSGSSLKPCNANQYRSKETNRCRNLASASTAPKPCKEGQERNPDTNRCRTIVKMPSADYGVLGAQTSSNGTWYVWVAIGGILLLAIGYAIWEWHHEIAGLFQQLRKFVRPSK